MSNARRVRRIIARSLVLVMSVVTAALLASQLHAAVSGLDPYRALTRSSDGRRLLAFTRAAVARALEPASDSVDASTQADSLDWPGAPCGVIVSLVHGRATRACVGSLTPIGGGLGRTLERLAADVVAADPRHPPVRRDELEGLRVVVAFTSSPEVVADPMQVAPAREGLLVVTPRGSVAYLPGEARTIAWALREARRAGILQRTADATFQRFAAVIVQEPFTSQETPDASP